jgi:hypothetical protein
MSNLFNDPAPSARSGALLRAAQLDDPVAKAATLKIDEEYERLATRAASEKNNRAHPINLPSLVLENAGGDGASGFVVGEVLRLRERPSSLRARWSE